MERHEVIDGRCLGTCKLACGDSKPMEHRRSVDCRVLFAVDEHLCAQCVYSAASLGEHFVQVTNRHGAFSDGGRHALHRRSAHVARQGLRWWEIDVTWYVLVVLEALHVVWDVKRPRSAAPVEPPA